MTTAAQLPTRSRCCVRRKRFHMKGRRWGVHGKNNGWYGTEWGCNNDWLHGKWSVAVGITMHFDSSHKFLKHHHARNCINHLKSVRFFCPTGGTGLILRCSNFGQEISFTGPGEPICADWVCTPKSFPNTPSAYHAMRMFKQKVMYFLAVLQWLGLWAWKFFSYPI